jgi:hypothetical protein
VCGGVASEAESVPRCSEKCEVAKKVREVGEEGGMRCKHETK